MIICTEGLSRESVRPEDADNYSINNIKHFLIISNVAVMTGNEGM